MLNEREIEMKKVNVVDLIKYLNDEFNFETEVSVDEFDFGSGVYSIVIGSRGYIEEICKVEDFKLRTVDEILDLYDEEDINDFIEVREFIRNEGGEVKYIGMFGDEDLEYTFKVIDGDIECSWIEPKWD